MASGITTNYSPLNAELTTYATGNGSSATFWQLYERAARARYGEDITVVKNSYYEGLVNSIAFQVSVVEKEREPREVTRTIVDITTKEYTNRGKDVVDETMIKLQKATATPGGEKYRFTTPGGVNFGFSGDIGSQVMAMSISGGSLLITGQFSGTSRLQNEHAYSLSYNREEKISVPPATRVTAKIVSYSNKYEMLYTLKFRVSRNTVVPLLYRTSCCLFTCRKQGVVFVSDMISSLPNYTREDHGTASFVQTGTLSWIGESCSVDKLEEPI